MSFSPIDCLTDDPPARPSLSVENGDFRDCCGAVKSWAYVRIGRASIVIPSVVVCGGSEGQADVASARSFLVLARAMPMMRTNRPIAPFWRAKTCSTAERAAGLRALPQAVAWQ
jgi:hypothetical protein